MMTSVLESNHKQVLLHRCPSGRRVDQWPIAGRSRRNFFRTELQIFRLRKAANSGRRRRRLCDSGILAGPSAASLDAAGDRAFDWLALADRLPSTTCDAEKEEAKLRYTSAGR